MTVPQPYPANRQPRAQRTPAVALRLLLSVSLLVACVPLLRLTLVSAPFPASVGSQRLTQQEPLGAARTASLALSGDWADVHLISADLQGNLMRGEIVLPKEARVQHTQESAAGTLKSAFTVLAPPVLESPQPLRFTLNRQGLNLIGMARSGRPVTWNVKVGRKVPTEVSVNTRSGDQDLDLRGAVLSGLRVGTQSGVVSVQLPGSFAGSARLNSESGDLIVEQTGTRKVPSAPNLSIEARSASGTQLLNLGATSFARVRASTSSGDLKVQLPERPGVAASLNTQSGDLRVSVPAALVNGDVNAQTSSGDVDLIVPVGASVRLSASPFLGDLNVPESYVQEGGAYLSPAARRGVPALNVSLSTQSGSMTVSEEQP